jgi:alkylation response protein AidB-like acyl-CoA dehydrogenase
VSTVEATAPYRERVRQALGGFDVDDGRAWEACRHVPTAAIRTLAAADLFRARWEAGAEGGLPRLVVLSRELFRYNSGLAVAAMGHSEVFVGALVWLAGTESQHALLARALDGQVVGCFAATEAQGGSSLADVSTAAVPTAEGWRLTGTKRYVSNVGSATHALVLAREQEADVAGDLSLFILPLDTPGLAVDGFFRTSGVPACDVGQITFDVRLPRDARVGRGGLGLLYASHLLQFERLSICTQLLEAGECALALAAAYARQRRVAGSRVMDRQVIRHRLASARAELWNLHSRLAHLVETAARGGGMPAHEIAALKLTAGQRVTDIIEGCVRIFGARGNGVSHPVERLLQDCRVARLGGGTDEVLADMVAAFVDRPDAEAERRLQAMALADRPWPDDRRHLG